MDTSNQQQYSQPPVIAGHEIVVDQHGRFSLSAIFRASGEGRGKEPSYWTVTKQAKELIAEAEAQSKNSWIEDGEPVSPIKTIRGGKTPGTYAHELLAISYAGWISPKFQLQVNQVFLDYRMGKLQAAEQQKALPNPLSPRHQRGIQKAVARRCQALPEPARRSAYSRLYGHLKDRFEVGSYKDIDDSRYTEALGAVQSFELEGDWLEADREPGAATFTDEDLSDLYILLCHVYHLHAKWKGSRIEEAMRILESPVASRMCEHLDMAQTFTNRLARAKGELMEVSRRRLGMNYGLLPIH
ncbi:KilA-N domain-containing protein [Halomonas sp. H33-56]|uniref:KilA-N domain-containing protein n=1 Tax=Halomonas sp. H33-56 TaxID=2950873 RepID=UPI0032DFD3C8